MTPDPESTPTADTTEATADESASEEADATLLEQSQAAIDDAHEAVRRVAATDAIGEDTVGGATTDDPAADS